MPVPPLAAAAADVPVLGDWFQVLTIRSYHAQEENAAVEIDQPALEGGGTLTERVNQEISERVEAREAEGRRIVEEYKEAFLATGGTEEEWDARPAPGGACQLRSEKPDGQYRVLCAEFLCQRLSFHGRTDLL